MLATFTIFSNSCCTVIQEADEDELDEDESNEEVKKNKLRAFFRPLI